jgi:ABC-2 type transport system permease protein
MASFLWSKFWTGLPPILVLAEALTILSNELLGAAPALRILSAAAIFVMSFALVGLATGMGAQHPRFAYENITQVAGSYGGIAFMVLAVLFILTEIGLLAWPASSYLWHQFRGLPIPVGKQGMMVLCCLAALALGVATFIVPMRRGVRALETLG